MTLRDRSRTAGDGTVSKSRQLAELPEPGLDQVLVHGQEPADAEILDGERGHDAAVNRGPADVTGRKAPRLVEIAEKPAGEAIPRPGRVDDVLAGVGQDAEDEIAAEDERPVLALLEQHQRRAQPDQGLAGADEVRL